MLEQINPKLAMNMLDDLSPTQTVGIVEGFIEGAVYSDRLQPKAVLIATKGGTYSLQGELDDRFARAFMSFYAKKRHERFTLFSTSTGWGEFFLKPYKRKIQ